MAKQFVCTQTEPVVSTKAGKIRGFLYDGIYNFHGIRYARARRFEMPIPVKPWDGVKDALSYGYICPVLDNPKPSGEVLTPHRFWPESEHCQYLNIWTDSIDPSAKKPVMVWFHGGGFSAGSSIEQVAYDGTNLAKYKGVVLVSINHRLNVFGHLDLSSFGEKYKNSVNAGMADIVASLEWIRGNIAGFGGDPENVTIFGQSGGGGKVTALGQIPAADGLYHKAIIMSGVMSENMMKPEIDNRELVLAIMDQLGIEDHDPEKLAKVPTPLLKRAVNAVDAKYRAQGKRIEWCPQPNEWYSGNPLEIPFGDYARKVPTLIGTVIAEFGFGPGIPNKNQLTSEERRAIVAGKFGEENADRIIALFRKAFPGKNEADVIFLDQMFRPATLRYLKKKAAESSAPTYSYMFTNEFDYEGGKLAWHCSDIAFFFHNASDLPICQKEGVTEQLEEKMSSAFTNFAKTGDPNAEGLPAWETCSGDSITTMFFDKECETRTDNEEELMNLLLKVTPPFRFDPSMIPTEDGDEGFEEPGNAWVY